LRHDGRLAGATKSHRRGPAATEPGEGTLCLLKCCLSGEKDVDRTEEDISRVSVAREAVLLRQTCDNGRRIRMKSGASRGS
jgi:hypothetical protein